MTPNPTNGFITRSNLPSPLSNLTICASSGPIYALQGDQQEAADSSSLAGIGPSLSARKYVWASSPFVAGQQPVLATPDNSTLDLRLSLFGSSFKHCLTTLAAEVITAISTQMAYQVSVTVGTGGGAGTMTWNCFPGVYQVAINQYVEFANILPIYVSLPRTPIPAAGPV